MLFACEYCGLIEMIAGGGLLTMGCAGTMLLSKLTRKKPQPSQEDQDATRETVSQIAAGCTYVDEETLDTDV